MLWFTKNKNGEIPVRKIADKVINSYRDLIYSHKQIDEERAELNYAEKRALQEIPHIREKINKTEVERERSIRLIDELREKYNKERDTLVSGKGGIETLLKQVHEKRLHYEQINIEEIIKRVAQEGLQNGELARISTMKEELTRAYQDVLSKYSSLFMNLDADLSLFENNKQTQILEKRLSVAERQEKAMAQSRAEEDKVRTASEEKLQTVEQRLAQLRGEEMQMKLKQQKMLHEEHYKKEISDCEAGIDELCRRDKELDLQIRRQQMDIGQRRNECELKRKELEMAAQRSMDAVRREKADVEGQLQALDALIEKRKGSFCDWLEQHNPGWQETIGKVADEELVLYNNELQPQLVNKEATLFGVSLNLTAIERSVRTPEEMKQERDRQQAARQLCTDRLTRLTEEEGEAVSSLEKKYSKQIHSILEEQHLMEAERMQIPAKLKNLQADYASWKTKEEEWKRGCTEELQAQLNEIGHRLYVAEGEKEKHLAEREKLLKACRKVYNDSRTELRKELEEFVASVQLEIERMKQQTAERKKELKQAQENELNGKGADTVTIRKYDDRLAEINKELDYIGKSRPQVLFYERDKEELFDKEPATRSRKKELDAKLVALDERFALKKEKLQVQKKGADEHLERIGKELHLLEDGLNKVDMFRKDETFCPPSVTEIGEKPTRKNCDVIVEELKSLIVSTIRKTEEFKKAVTQFNGNFSSKNTFHFRTELVGEQDYYDFASNLCEFVDNDKISDYQKHISERYTDIIRRISQEVGGLTRNESEIHRTIKDINDDFVKRNFAGVIKEIALRPLQSSDKLMQLLLEIKRFSDENQYNMGKVDLFSQDSREDVNAVAVRHLLSFMKFLLDEPGRRRLALADTFKLEFRVKENDNDTGWVEKIANVGSDGTDILVKAMVNIMLINVFKEKASRKFGDFKIHCMMDEIGKLHPNNVKGILDFANCRNILLVNSSPTTYNVEDYRYTYLLSKDGRSNTQVVPLLTYNKIEK